MNKLIILNNEYTISDWVYTVNNNLIKYLYYKEKFAGFVSFELCGENKNYFSCVFVGHLAPLSKFFDEAYKNLQYPLSYDKLEEVKNFVDNLIFKYFKLLAFI